MTQGTLSGTQASYSQTAEAANDKAGEERVSLWFLFWTFLKIGSIAFGGFMALVSVVENTIVRRRGLLEHKEMLDGISLANLLPGPMAVNVVAFVGYRLRGPAGALATASGVLLPTFVLILILSHLYFTYGHIAALGNVFRGLIPAVAANLTIVENSSLGTGPILSRRRDGAIFMSSMETTCPPLAMK